MSWAGRSVACLAAWLLVGTVGLEALAEPQHPRVRLQIHGCTGADEGEVRHLVGVELGALLTDKAEEAEVTEVSVSCEREHVWLRVDDPLTGKTLSRVVDLSEDPISAQARLVALAVAELVVASWTELATNPVPQVPPAGRRPSAKEVAAARSVVATRVPKQMFPHTGELRLVAVAARRSFFNDPTVLWGGGVRVAGDAFPTVGWTLDLLAERGETELPLGRVDLDTFTAGGGLYLYRRWEWMTFQVGAGLRLGIARLSGKPNEETQATAASGIAPWGWPTAAVGLRVEPRGPIVVEASAETGYVVLPMSGTVEGNREVTVDGLWLGVQLGVGLVL